MKNILFSFILLFIACGNNTEDSEKIENAQLSKIDAKGRLTWSAPGGWIEEVPRSAMRKAQFRLPKIAGDPEDATLVVFYFHGEGGSVNANLQRWYGQFTQPDGRASKEVAKVSKSEVNGLNQTIVDLSGTYLFKTTPMAPTSTEKPNFRMLAAVVESNSGPWFVKMVGPQKTVTHWEDSFYHFMKTFKE